MMSSQRSLRNAGDATVALLRTLALLRKGSLAYYAMGMCDLRMSVPNIYIEM